MSPIHNGTQKKFQGLEITSAGFSNHWKLRIIFWRVLRIGMKWFAWFLIAACADAAIARTDDEPRPGVVEFSNGETLEGNLSLTPGAELKIIDGTKLSTLKFDRVREIRFAPEEEKMEQKWRFPVAGDNRKEKWGLPYPTRYIRATIVLADGATLPGHLYTTVLYVEGKEKNEKVILLAKQRGEEGETMQALVYPTRIAFKDEAVAVGKNVRLQLGMKGEVTALTRSALVRLEARGDQLPSPLGADVFLAVKDGDKITVGWPAECDAKWLSLVQDALPNVRDFFDARKLLGVWHDPVSGDVYSAMMLERKGKTTLHAEESLPWRCEVWRWKHEPDENRLLLAGRGYFFRGILARNAAAPIAVANAKLWNLKRGGDVWAVQEP